MRPNQSRLAEGLTIWFTGLPSSGKTTLARALSSRLSREDHRFELLDGDVVRQHLGRELGFSRQDRDENVRRIGYVANLLSRNGVVVLCSVISPYRSIRDELRTLHDGRFFEVYVSTPLDVCQQRDVKGLYAKASSGEIASMTGVDDPYEPPLHPEAVVPTQELSLEESVERVWKALHQPA